MPGTRNHSLKAGEHVRREIRAGIYVCKACLVKWPCLAWQEAVRKNMEQQRELPGVKINA